MVSYHLKMNSTPFPSQHSDENNQGLDFYKDCSEYFFLLKHALYLLQKGFWILFLLTLFYFILTATLPPAPLAQEKTIPQGTLKVVDLWAVHSSIEYNYLEGLVTLDKDNNYVPCLAEVWKWIDERTIEFRLRRGVTFQDGFLFPDGLSHLASH